MKGRLSGFHSCRLSALILYIFVVVQREVVVLYIRAACIPSSGCGALVYYTERIGDTLEIFTQNFQTSYPDLQSVNSNLSNINVILNGSALYIPFDCPCVNDQLLHSFSYTVS